MRCHQRSHRFVILADNLDQLLRLGGLGKRGEATQVEVDNADIGAVPGEEAAAVLGREEGRDLGRHETCELNPLLLDRLKELRVADRDRALIREGCHQVDLFRVERSNVTPTYLNDPNQLVLDHYREPEQRANVCHLDPRIVVVGVGGDVGNVRRTVRQGYATSHGLNAQLNGVQPLILHHLGGHSDVRVRVKQVALGEMNQSVLRATKRGRCLGNPIKNRLQTHT